MDAIVVIGSFNLSQDKNLMSHNSVTEGFSDTIKCSINY